MELGVEDRGGGIGMGIKWCMGRGAMFTQMVLLLSKVSVFDIVVGGGEYTNDMRKDTRFVLGYR